MTEDGFLRQCAPMEGRNENAMDGRDDGNLATEPVRYGFDDIDLLLQIGSLDLERPPFGPICRSAHRRFHPIEMLVHDLEQIDIGFAIEVEMGVDGSLPERHLLREMEPEAC